MAEKLLDISGNYASWRNIITTRTHTRGEVFLSDAECSSRDISSERKPAQLCHYLMAHCGERHHAYHIALILAEGETLPPPPPPPPHAHTQYLLQQTFQKFVGKLKQLWHFPGVDFWVMSRHKYMIMSRHKYMKLGGGLGN